MRKITVICFVIHVCFFAQSFAQIPTTVAVQIIRAEDERRYDKTLEDLMKMGGEKLRIRAALAAGRIGDDRAVPALINLLGSGSSGELREMAAFALGEIESVKAADAILKNLANEKLAPETGARLIEAAGKIAAANAKDPKAIEISKAILDVLDAEARRPKQDRLTVLLGLTAILRARPEKGDSVAARFLTNIDPRIRADAANTLSRIRAKNANELLRAMLLADDDAIARANAARALGAAEDKESFNILMESALTDDDSRVRVSAIRSLGSLKDAKAADRLLTRGENLLNDYKKSKFAFPVEKNELLEIAATLGRILPNANDKRAINFLIGLRTLDKLQSPETEIAMARISPAEYLTETNHLPVLINSRQIEWRNLAAVSQGLGELSALPDKCFDCPRQGAESILRAFMSQKNLDSLTLAIPDLLRAFATFKTNDLAEILRGHLKHKDTIVRATAVELLGELPPEQIRFGDFEDSFRIALEDEKLNDALLATIEAIGKQKTERAADFLKDRIYYLAKLNPKYGTSKYLARRRISALLKEKGAGDFSDKLGKTDSIFTPTDYVRAFSRRNARAILTTEKGTFTIEFTLEDAPLTVDNFIKLAKSNYFNGLTIHRVVPNFVMQDGDPRGDGNGGPGWEIRDEINRIPYERGAVGMALSGKDTGGSQWFVTHAPQPHLDGGYTVFGRVNETDMKIVDNLARGDKILSVKIVEGNLPVKKRK